MKAAQEDDFREFAAVAIPVLHRVAVASVRDRQRADDFVQSTLEKMYVAWPRINRDAGNPLAYARTVLVRSIIDETRRPWWRFESSRDAVPERSGATDAYREVDGNQWVAQVLDQLSPRQRTAVVLRHLEGLPVREIAQIVGTSESNVKAATAEGLAVLRRVVATTLETNGVGT